MRGWIFPLDPECPAAKKLEDALNDPMMEYSGCGDEFEEDFTRKHQQKCRRCQEYGFENVDVSF